MNQDFEPQNYHLQTNAILTFFGHSAQERDRKDLDNKIILEIVLGAALLFRGSLGAEAWVLSLLVLQFLGVQSQGYSFSFAGIPPKPSASSGSKSTDSTSLIFKTLREATGEMVWWIKHLPGKL